MYLTVWGVWTGGARGLSENGPQLESLFGIAVAILCLLTALNALLHRFRPTWTFSRGECVTIYLVVVFTVGLSASVYAWGGNLATSIAFPIWYASPENGWQTVMWPYLPPGLAVTDRDALQGFFLGNSSPYSLAILRAWVQPVVWWTAFVTALLTVTLCISVIVRRRWADEERLPFPITILPMQMSDPSMSLFRNRLWWAGIAIAAGLQFLQSIHTLYPAVPEIPLSFNTQVWIRGRPPWDGMRFGDVMWGPWQLGLCFLMPLDLAFSLLVFNLFWRTEYIFCRAQGWMVSPWSQDIPYGDQQIIGGYLALVVAIAWLDRRYLLAVLREALGLSSPLDDRREAMSYRTALTGCVAGCAFLWWFFIRAGMTPVIVGAFLLLLLMMLIAMMRLRAQVGPPGHWMYGTMPEFVLAQFPGMQALTPRTLGLIAMLRPFMYEQNSNPVPAQIEGLYMADRGVVNPRRLALVLIGTIPFIMICYFWASLDLGYRAGVGAKGATGLTFVSRQAWGKLEDWLRYPTAANWSGTGAIGVGVLITLLLTYIRLRFPMWPLHPVAFPLAFSWTIDVMVLSIAITCVIKAVLLRYGGLRAHQQALPLFLGFIAGSATATLLEEVLALALHAR
jgi:hypothetical protein